MPPRDVKTDKETLRMVLHDLIVHHRRPSNPDVRYSVAILGKYYCAASIEALEDKVLEGMRDAMT